MMQTKIAQLVGSDWASFLKPIFDSEEFAKISAELAKLQQSGSQILPPKDHIFEAFKACPKDRHIVTVIGQSPYHRPGLATGIAFEVPEDKQIPPSLEVINEAVYRETATPVRHRKQLRSWAAQGMLLLNSAFTVEAGKPSSHQDLWKPFTQLLINRIASQGTHIFLLWGKYAAEFSIPDEVNHFVFESFHPVVEARSKGKTKFFGHFARANEVIEGLYGSEFKITF